MAATDAHARTHARTHTHTLFPTPPAKQPCTLSRTEVVLTNVRIAKRKPCKTQLRENCAMHSAWLARLQARQAPKANDPEVLYRTRVRTLWLEKGEIRSPRGGDVAPCLGKLTETSRSHRNLYHHRPSHVPSTSIAVSTPGPWNPGRVGRQHLGSRRSERRRRPSTIARPGL